MDFGGYTRLAFLVFSAAAAIFLIEALYLAISGPLNRKRNVNRRLKLQAGNLDTGTALQLLRNERGIFDRDLEVIGSLRKLLIQSGLRLTLGKFVVMCGVVFLALTIALQLLLPLPAWQSVIVAAAAAGLMPLQIVRFIRGRRQSKFSEQLPDALDVAVRSLKSGHPVPVALAMVGREMPDPIGTEFGLTIDEMTYGLDMPNALKNLAGRVGVADLSLLVTAVSLQSGAGGNLSEVLGNLSKVLRSRFQLRRKVRSLSAEGRVSAYGLTILPILIFFAIYLQNPRYYTDVQDDPKFLPILVGVAVWSLIGDFIMYKMINFKY